MVHTGLHGANWLAPTWSLAVEEQFYLTLPLLIAIVPRRRLAWVLLVLICSSPLLRISLMAIWPENSMAEIVLMPCRADALLMGVLAAVAVRHEAWRARIGRSDTFFKVAFVVLMAGVAFLGRFAPGISFPWMRSVGFSWLALFYVSVLLFAVTRQSSLLSRCLRNRPLMWLGSIAYGVYLMHEAVQGIVFGYLKHAAPGIYGWRDLPLALLSLAVTLAVARASWIYFERPLVQIGHRWQYRSKEGAVLEGGSASAVHVST